MQNKSKLNTILLIVIIVLLVIGLVYIFLNKNSKQKNNELINQNINTISSDGKEYTFINPKCVIAGSSDRSGTVTWFMGIRFIADQSKESGIYFDIKNINKPIVGYIGKLARRFDVALISFLAKELPYMNFVILGQILNKDWIKPLYGYKNIYILGDRHYSLMSQYLKNFDICIIPHNIRSQDSGENSIKLYEYLAAGKPVVTTNFGGVEIFKDNIKIAFTKEDFLEGIIDYNVKLTKDRDYFNKLKNLITSELTWGYKANFMINEIIKIYKNTGNL